MNLLVISIDSLRLDFVSRTGARVRTPSFDAQTRGFCFYDRLFSVSSATRPVHASLFTGLYPFEHGILGQRSPDMHQGIPHLFELFRRAGGTAAGFSEATKIFTGLPFEEDIVQLGAETGLRQLERVLDDIAASPCFLFVHYWSAHTPYGAADGKAYGETGRLLSAGRREIVQERYARAVEQVCDFKIAPLLARLDPRQWCIFIVSDHGESWTAEEPYHGQTLRNSVLRVPLYYHIPLTGNPPPPRPLLSIVDLYPTFVVLFDLPVSYAGFGRDIRQQEARADPYLAQIHPLAGRDDLEPVPGPALSARDASPGPQWALFDPQRKFTYYEKRREGILEKTLSEEPLAEEGATGRYLQAYAQLQRQSSYARMPLEGASRARDDLLDRRLRQLGYLD